MTKTKNRNRSEWQLPSYPIRYTVFTLAVAILIIGALTSCTSDSTHPTTVTILATATSTEPLLALPDSLTTELVAMAKRAKQPGQATVRLITNTTGEPITLDLVPVRPNGQVQHAHGDADRQVREAITELENVAADLTATEPGLNLLTLLDRAGQGGDGPIHAVSSGVSTESPLDLRVIGWESDPETIIDSIDRQGFLPRLNNRHVTFHGLGVVAGTQPALPPFARSFIESLYVRLCERAGAASCTLAPGVPSAAPPIATLPVPVVPVPAAFSEAGCPVWVTLSESDTVVRFAPDSAILPTSADDALRPLVEAVSRCRIERIDLTGHIAETTNRDTRSNLSQRRAQAVADRLVQLGLSVELLGSISGRDAREPVVPNLTADGQFDELKAQQNRRVEVVFIRTE